MSQEQPRRPQYDQDPVKYGDVFDVRGNLASEPVAPVDAASMQSAESQVLGQTQKGGPAAVMQSAASANVRGGLVDPDESSEAVREEGVTVTEENIDGTRLVTESVGGQVVGQYVDPAVRAADRGSPTDITIGEALEATAYTAAGEKPVDQSDAAAINVAEVRALGSNDTPSSGIGAYAQSAADHNARLMRGGNKTTLSDVLADATTKLPRDKPVTPDDAARVTGAEIRNKPDMKTTPGGVAASMASAARLNQNT